MAQKTFVVIPTLFPYTVELIDADDLFVKMTFKATYEFPGGTLPGAESLIIYDHRPETIEATQQVLFESKLKGIIPRHKTGPITNAAQSAMARFSVSTDGGTTYNLYPIHEVSVPQILHSVQIQSTLVEDVIVRGSKVAEDHATYVAKTSLDTGLAVADGDEITTASVWLILTSEQNRVIVHHYDNGHHVFTSKFDGRKSASVQKLTQSQPKKQMKSNRQQEEDETPDFLALPEPADNHNGYTG